ncbi:MAG: sulfite exporter TauE/SafE family protein [Bacteroidota bacterium]
MIQELFLVIISGFSIGIIGSFHCIGMCGPIALSLPVNQYTTTKKTLSILLYNLGRATTYAILGVIFGILGQSFELFKLQQYTSIFAGFFILWIVLFSSKKALQIPYISSFSIKIKTSLANVLRSEKTSFSYFTIGLLNGFLPCGLVYVAIAAAVATGFIYKSAWLMFAFGLGTMPLMIITMSFGKYISSNIKNRINSISPYLIILVAVLLILRGLNLGIPYVSPKEVGTHKTCCHS